MVEALVRKITCNRSTEEKLMPVDDSEIPDPFGLTVAMVVGPYFGDGSYAAIDANIDFARRFAIALANLRIGFFCAHTHTAHFEALAGAPESFYLGLDLRFLSQADCAIFIPGWENSSGSQREHALAKEWGIPCFYPSSVEDLGEIKVWASNRPANGVLPIIRLLVETDQWIRDLCNRYDLRGWNHADSCMLDRITDVVALRPVNNLRVLEVLAQLLGDVSVWAGDFLAFAHAMEDDGAQRRRAATLDNDLVQAHYRIRQHLAAAA